jgi:hypothetical protein
MQITGESYRLKDKRKAREAQKGVPTTAQAKDPRWVIFTPALTLIESGATNHRQQCVT